MYKCSAHSFKSSTILSLFHPRYSNLLNIELLLWLNVDVLSLVVVASVESLVGQAHLTSEGGMWLPLGGGTWSRLLQHLVDLLKGETLGLWNHEVGKDEGSAAEGSPHEEDLGSKIGLPLLGSDKVWSDDGNDAVPHPVGGG